jgi:hypothetical protein
LFFFRSEQDLPILLLPKELDRLDVIEKVLLKPALPSRDEIPDDAIRSSQSKVCKFLGQTQRGGIMESFKRQGLLDYWGEGPYWVRFRQPTQHDRFRQFMENRGRTWNK